MNALETLLASQPFIVLDGAFATELERLGCNINDPLWSATALYKSPELVKKVHRFYLDAGADIITSASYQATIPGFLAKGFSREEAEALLKRSLALAKKVRDEFEAETGRHALVAASIGPYGAYLADGSEYRGHYTIGRNELADFHRSRMELLAEEGPDLFACETFPSLVEAEAVSDVLHDIPGAAAWFSFSCKSETLTCGDDAIEDCARFLDTVPEALAVGVNCTAPEYVASLIRKAAGVTKKPVLVYPNSGETYDPVTKTWKGAASSYPDYAREWYEAGARMIGGCCRTTPDTIRAVADFRKSLAE